MSNRYPSTIDRFTQLVTLAILVLILAVIISILATSDFAPLPTLISIAALAGVIALYFASIKAVVVTDHELIVERKIGQRVYSLTEIEAVRPITTELLNTLRLFGNGGLFGYMGWFRNSNLGTYHANANRRDSQILLTFEDGKLLVLSANQSVELAQEIERRLDAQR